ncbi:MAG: site-specific integrase [Desulfobacterales bacterium]
MQELKITELRQKFDKHLTLHRFSPKINEAYMNALKSLAAYYRQPPDRLTDAQTRDYLDYIIADIKLAWSTCNVHSSGIKRFYKHVLDRRPKLSIPPRPAGEPV